MSNVVSFDKMEVGLKGEGAHWTKQEVESRKKAAEKLTRKEPVALKKPAWLSKEAKEVWDKTLNDLKGFDILDNIDAEALAVYCDAVARYAEITKKLQGVEYVQTTAHGGIKVNPLVSAQRNYAVTMMQYADKLGITPDGRARLARKMAQKEVNPNDDLFN